MNYFRVFIATIDFGIWKSSTSWLRKQSFEGYPNDFIREYFGDL
jgi:hypothetical protein